MKISIYAAPELDEALARNGGGRNRSHRINQIADRYAEMLRRTSLPDMSEAEWSLLRDALNGVVHEPAAMIAHLAHGVADAIRLDGLDRKWGVDGAALVAKLEALDYAQEVRLLEDIEAWWSYQGEQDAAAQQ